MVVREGGRQGSNLNVAAFVFIYLFVSMKTYVLLHCSNFFASRIFSEGVPGGARMPARSVCLVTLSLSEAGTGRFGGQASVTDLDFWYVPDPTISFLDYIKQEHIRLMLTFYAAVYIPCRLG